MKKNYNGEPTNKLIDWYDELSDTKSVIIKVSFILSPFIVCYGLNIFNFNLALIFMIMSLLVSTLAMLYAVWTLIWILKKDNGTPEMQKIAKYITDGSEGFFIA